MFRDLTTRRVFIQKGLTLLSVGVTIPSFLDRTVMALAMPDDVSRTQQQSGKDGKILVVVQLSGGNDGLNTVVPYGDDVYHRSRPNLGIGNNEVLKLTDYIGLHPQLTALKGLYDDGRLAVVQGVGYPNPNRSHFRSMDIWQSGQPDNQLPSSGWLGRYFDNTCSGIDPNIGVSMGETLPMAMRGERIVPLSFERPDQYRYNGNDRQRFAALNQLDDAPPTTNPTILNAPKKIPVPTAHDQLDYLTRTAMDAQVSSDTILKSVQNHNPPVPYPGNEFGQGLRTVAAMIAGGLPTRVYYVSLGGFDTHAGERGRHDQLMKQFSDGVNAFMADLKNQHNDDRVLMMTFSEFGRRVEQNASGGTDHGAAAPMFLIGQKVNSGLIGDHPSLTNLDQGDLKYNVDFRNVYATVLQNWLNAPSKPILGEQFRTINAFKA